MAIVFSLNSSDKQNYTVIYVYKHKYAIWIAKIYLKTVIT